MNIKKLMAGVLSAAMVFGTTAFPAFADDTAVTVKDTDELKAALADKAVTEITVDGKIEVKDTDFKTDREVTIKGTNPENDKLVFTNATKAYKIDFKNVGFDWPTANYNGLQHSTKLTYTGCKISGMPFLYAEEEIFNNCEFNQTSSGGYNLWTYGAKKVTFNGCTFNCAGKSVLVYNEGAVESTTVNVNGCQFIASEEVSGKAAIEIDSSLVKGEYVINIDSDNSYGETNATGFATGSNSDNSLYNTKKFKVKNDDDDGSLRLNTSVSIKGTPVLPVREEILNEAIAAENPVAVNDGKYYNSLSAAAAAAAEGDTIKLCDDVTTAEQVLFGKSVKFDLNGHTLTSNYSLKDENNEDKAGNARYAVVFENGGTFTDSATEDAKGTLVANLARALTAGGMLNVENTTVKCGATVPSGNAVIGTTGGLDMKNTTVIGEFEGSYAVSSFGTTGTEEYNIENSVITAATVGIYRNGSAGKFKMSVKDTKITANSPDQNLAVYISNNNSNNDTNHIVSFENCEISGETGIEAKYSDIKLTNCDITATGTPSYVQNNNGATARGFAIVITDNAKGDVKAVPCGKVEISGGNYTGLIGLENYTGASQHIEVATDVEITGGSFTADVSKYCASGFAPKKIGDVWVVDNSATKVSIGFNPSTTDARVYDIVVNAVDADEINRLNTADLTFALTATNAADSTVSYTVTPAENITLTPDLTNENRYMFSFNTKDSVADSGNSVTIGQVRFEGYTVNGAKIKFETVLADSLVTATTKSDNLVTYFGTDGDALSAANIIDDVEFAVPTNKLTVNIAMNNKVNDNAKAYQKMKVAIAGGTYSEEIELGTDGGAALANDAYVIERELTENTAYTVTVSGAGYRTARYTVNHTNDKTLNFWNNVADNAIEVELGNDAYKKDVTFLAGDIVKDGKINIYDLSAVVSYFGTNNEVDAESEYVKYDLNRDGKIDSKDVAYVLVSWGE